MNNIAELIIKLNKQYKDLVNGIKIISDVNVCYSGVFRAGLYIDQKQIKETNLVKEFEVKIKEFEDEITKVTSNCSFNYFYWMYNLIKSDLSEDKIIEKIKFYIETSKKTEEINKKMEELKVERQKIYDIISEEQGTDN